MNALDICVYTYSALHNRRGISRFAFSPFRRLVRSLTAYWVPRYFQRTPLPEAVQQTDLTVSLTSFPARIHKVSRVIQCFLRQTVSPTQIILWLSKEQFAGQQLPDELLALQGNIFSIRWVDGDIRSHKKYFYVLSEYPSQRVLLVDDDLYYPTDMVETMLKAACQYPGRVICRYGSLEEFKDGELLPYRSWWREIAGESDHPHFFFGSGGGTLLTRNMLYKDALNIDLALELTPLADDVWLNAMVNLQGTRKHKVKFGLILPVEDTQRVKLAAVNVGEDQNTVQIQRIVQYYQSKHQLNPFPENINQHK